MVGGKIIRKGPYILLNIPKKTRCIVHSVTSRYITQYFKQPTEKHYGMLQLIGHFDWNVPLFT